MILCLLCATILFAPVDANAQDYPVIPYTTKDGLTHDAVHRIVRDARGFLWIGNPTALTRFDGERFTAYGRADGLDVGTGVNDVREDSGNRLWIATNGAGIYRFNLAGTDRSRRLTQFQVGEGRASNRVNMLVVLATDMIWAATDAGLFAGGAARPFQRIALPIGSGQPQSAL